jgi:hypothetical protein
MQIWAALKVDTLNVYFDQGSNELSTFQADLIDQFLEDHKRFGQIVVAGHADASGNPIDNIEQSKLRALEVAKYLLQRQVPQNTLLLQAYGATSPIASNNAAIGRARNRRVELHVFKNAPKTAADPNVPVENLTLENGATLPFQQMTLDGEKLRKLYVINLEREVVYQSFVAPAVSINPLLERNIWSGPTPMRLRLPIQDSLVCYAGSINFDATALNQLMDRSTRGDQLLIADKDSLGYYFAVNLLDSLDVDPSFKMGKDCHVINSAYLKTEGKMMLRSFSASSRSNQLSKAYEMVDANTFRVFWLDDRMQDTRLNLAVKRKKRSRKTKAPINLGDLRYNGADNTFWLNKQTFKQLQKEHKSKR